MTVFGVQPPQADGDDYNSLMELVQSALAKVQTITICRVVSCTNAGGITPAGTVNVKPLVNQMTGDRVAIPHGVIYSVPYSRIQGGNSAIIIDPAPGDLCVVGFASRDISSVVAAKSEANPGSFRQFNWADGIYIMGICNQAPTQYVVFSGAGITFVSPTKISLMAPEIDIVATDKIVINSPDNAIDSPSHDGTAIDGFNFVTHFHEAGTYVAGSTGVSGHSGEVG